jgi:exoribonuclease-2
VRGLDEQLRIQDRVAQLLRRTRHERGALSLETTRARAVFSNGVLSDMRDEQKNRAHELIEDLMIAANGVTARYLKEKRYPAIRRALRAPARWDRIVTLAAQRGETLPITPDARALDEFLLAQRAAHPESFAELSLAVVKLLGSGEYTLELPDEPAQGHFGLAAQDYTHSTAPNRRFPDLLTQRLLKAALTGATPPYSEDELRALAAHCSEQEKNASKVERQINKSAAALLLAARIGETFDAIVTGASDKGTWVRISHPAADGKVVRGFEGMDVGDRVRVRLDHVDSQRGFIDFSR